MSKHGTTVELLGGYRANFADYTMTKRGVEPAIVYQLRKPGYGGMEGVDVVLLGGDGVAERIIVTGDLCPNDNQGCASNIGYGLGWFAGKSSGQYLCSKFLRTTWVPEVARAALRDRLAEEEKEADESGSMCDRADAKTRAAKLAEAIENVEENGDSIDDPTRSAEAFYELWTDVYQDGPEDTGFDYDPRSAALLIAIQEAFARLYWAAREADEVVLKAELGPVQQMSIHCATFDDFAEDFGNPPVAQEPA
jgi:hypothetical protein